ncbi:HFL338Wp [Eremothecium sinecaudum]|uniref:HFL338Wp n=1 Tax=Eremothecium sinecaudum TaxID=45286 RepID=A0A0X8HU92_9SACH|nr:HFL338Wp [Eremothecium sinecaudum]AMD21518.1 HFL338Wp [Eremothecium sinecaudum]
MSHHKKRVYPQAQFQYGNQPAEPTSGVPAGQVQQGAQQQLFTPAQQLHHQIDQATTAMGGMQLHNVPVVDPNTFYQAGVASPPAVQQPVDSSQYNEQSFGYPVAMGKPMNQLYPIDLFQELPPPITDLSLPPPPLLVPPERIVVPSEDSNVSPDYLRCTLNALPKSSSLLKKSKLPLAMVIRPYLHLDDRVDPPPLNTDGCIVRCRRCRSYINPFVTFLEGGRRWRCNFCNLANDVPQAFDMDMQGVPINRYERNEIQHAVVEYLAPKEYAIRQPPPSCYAFIFDVSQNAIKNGLLSTAARTLLECLDTLPNHDERTRITILAVDHTIHYFSIPLDEEGDHIRMMDVVDLDEPFLPMPDTMFVSLKECRNNLEKLLNQIPDVFQVNILPKFALGPALKAAHNLIKGIGGKIIVVSSTLPNTGVGKLNKRNEASVANTSKEASQLLSCGDSFYKNFTIDCNKTQVTIDLFLASDEYLDVVSVSNLPRYTGGQTHFYPGFNAANLIDVTKFTKEFSKHINMDLSMEAVMRARGSTGLRMSRFYGHFFNRSSDLCAFSTFPRDQSYVFEVSIDEQIVRDYAYLQIALLLSQNTGQRRIRVITVCLPTTDNLAEVYASADQLAITVYYAQKGIEKVMSSSLEEAREYLDKSVQDVLATYKKEIAMSNTAGGAPLRLCANLRMWPLLMHSLTKHMAFRPGIIPADHRAAALNALESLPLPHFIKYIYPSVYSLHDMPDEAGSPGENGEIVLPQPINATSSLFERYGLYLIDTGMDMFLWLGGDAVPELVMDVFGTQDIMQIQVGKGELPIIENSEFSARVRNVIAKLREHDDIITYETLHIVRGASPSEPMNHASAREVASLRLWASSQLVEDKVQSSFTYREFLQSMKTKISK